MTRMQFSYGSVCSGIEAASVAWHSLGWRPAWFAEIEPNPAAILAHRWPDVPNLGDMTLLARYVRAGYIEAPDVLVGGTPCQAFSVAGLRGGLTDARGQLTLTYVDLANAIDEKRGAGNECVIYWENVPGVLSDATNAFGCLLGALAGESSPLVNAGGKWPNAGLVVGPQRAIAWCVLDAQYFRVAQRRRRVFLVASARNGFDPAKLLFELDGLRRDSPPRREAGQDVAGTLASRTGAGGYPGTDGACSGHVQHVAAACVTVCPTLRAGGNSTGGDRPPGTDVDTADSLIAYAFQPRIGRNGRGDMGALVNALTAQAGETGKGDAAPCVAYRHFEPPLVWRVRRLTPRECERLQGFPDDYTLVPMDRRKAPREGERRGEPRMMADGPRYKALGNSMAVPCMRWLGVRLMLTHPDYFY